MPSELLHCTICPKRPRFSDASHLLTHVSSKGHLSSLHKLQIRSHQEVGAGHELAIYNQWYHEHDVARLLSQRLLDKEAKQADKRAANRRRALGPTGGRPVAKFKRSTDAPINVSAYSAEASILQMRTTTKTDARSSGSDSDFTPLRRSSRIATHGFSPLKHDLLMDASNAEGEESLFMNQTARPNGSPQLKGTIWPGMHMFDAAPEEMKRKRNQRKDGSVLIRMEKTAAMIEPTETVHSATGEFLTQRHLDELETASPVPGETPVQYCSPRPRRTRVPKGPSSARKPCRSRRARKVQKSPLARRSRGRSSLTATRATPCRYTPTEDENIEFKLTFGNLGRNRKGSSFNICQDLSSSSFGSDGSAEAHNPFFSQSVGAIHSQDYLGYPPSAYPAELSNDDPYRVIQERLAIHDMPSGLHNKENFVPTFHTAVENFSSQILTPSMLHQHSDGSSAKYCINSTRDGTFGGIFSLYDPFNNNDSFTPARVPNPLRPIQNSTRRRRVSKPCNPDQVGERST